MPVEKRMEFAIVGKAMKGDVQAYREIKDTLYGKIADKVENSGPDGGPIQTQSTMLVIQGVAGDKGSSSDK